MSFDTVFPYLRICFTEVIKGTMEIFCREMKASRRHLCGMGLFSADYFQETVEKAPKIK